MATSGALEETKHRISELVFTKSVVTVVFLLTVLDLPSRKKTRIELHCHKRHAWLSEQKVTNLRRNECWISDLSQHFVISSWDPDSAAREIIKVPYKSRVWFCAFHSSLLRHTTIGGSLTLLFLALFLLVLVGYSIDTSTLCRIWSLPSYGSIIFTMC